MKQFPILGPLRGTEGPCPSSIPWHTIAPYENQALANHQQTLKRLAERGGLDPTEAFFVMTGRTWHDVPTPISKELQRESCAFIDKVAKDGANDQLRKKLEAAELQLSKAIPILQKYAEHNPKFYHVATACEQDPMGVHALLAKLQTNENSTCV